MNALSAPDWLVDEFAQRGYGTPELLHSGSNSVWGNEDLVAKVHHQQTLVDAKREAEISALAGTVIPTAQCLSVSSYSSLPVSWWVRVNVQRPASTCEAAHWVRELHDQVSSRYLDPVEWNLAPPVGSLRDASLLLAAAAPMIREAWALALELRALPPVLAHGAPDPANLVFDGDSVVGLDFGYAGAGPRILDVATLAVLAVETGEGSVETVLEAYGQHEDVTFALLADAAQVVAAARTLACIRTPSRLEEGWDRVGDYLAGRWYRAST